MIDFDSLYSENSDKLSIPKLAFAPGKHTGRSKKEEWSGIEGNIILPR